MKYSWREDWCTWNGDWNSHESWLMTRMRSICLDGHFCTLKQQGLWECFAPSSSPLQQNWQYRFVAADWSENLSHTHMISSCSHRAFHNSVKIWQKNTFSSQWTSNMVLKRLLWNPHGISSSIVVHCPCTSQENQLDRCQKASEGIHWWYSFELEKI